MDQRADAEDQHQRRQGAECGQANAMLGRPKRDDDEGDFKALQENPLET